MSADVLVPAFFWRVPLDDAERRFARYEYGVYCGGNAWHLVQVLDAEGIEAYTFNFGRDHWSHVIALARLDGELVALDPYLGHYLADGSGTPLPIRLHLDGLRSSGNGGPPGTWSRLPGTAEKTLIVQAADTIDRPGKAWLAGGALAVKGFHEGRLLLSHPSPPCWIDFLARSESLAGPIDFERHLLQPLTIADSLGQSLSFGVELGEYSVPAWNVARELGFDDVIPARAAAGSARMLGA